MSLHPGTRIGPYEITGAIGAGGMGEVFRARDTKLDRDVAIKVLPSELAQDRERLARFEREARLLASLNHSNIAHVYGFESATLTDGSTAHFLAMELVEGEDLAQRLARGAIPVDEAIGIAKQIAEGLEEAHEHGIIHRDLKPANVKVTRDGKVKILDFGLAKAMDPVGAAASNPNVSHSPTLTHQGTSAGMIIGTAAYMSPEQAKGKPVDKRADIWAFGVVLYEMLTGKRLFKSEDVSDTLAAVLREEVNWAALPAATSPHLKRLIQRCLDRDLRTRLRDIGEARIEIARIETGTAGSAASSGAAPSNGKPATLPWVMVTTLTIALFGTLAAWSPWRRPPAPPEVRLDVVTPPTEDPTSFAISPDGQQLVFEGSGESGSKLWLRSLSVATPQPIPGTEEGRSPFWSPDGRSIGFFAQGSLKRVDIGGGAPQVLTAGNGRGGTWGAGDSIVFTPDSTSALLRVSATGGPTSPVTTLGPRESSHRWPHFLPDGKRFLYYARGALEVAGIYLGTLDGKPAIRLTPADSQGEYLPSGWLAWVRAGTLVAQRLDASETALTGEPVTLATGVFVDQTNQRGSISVSAKGLIAYRTGGGGQRQLTWFDRSGTPRGVVGAPDDTLIDPHISPDGRRVVVGRTIQGNLDLWLLEGAHTSRLTFDPAIGRFPVWSPDGLRIAFRANRTGTGDLYQKLASGAGDDERLVGSDQLKVPTSWSPDGRFLLYLTVDPKTASDLWVVPTTGDHTPSVFLKTPFAERFGVFSPDGRWVAYQSNESGRIEIYVRPFVPPGGQESRASDSTQWQVSTAGGVTPLWRADGRELYYLNGVGDMMASTITIRGSALEPGPPVRLFPTRIFAGGADKDSGQGVQFDVGRDGRFLINTMLKSDSSAPITILQNWNPEVKR